MLVIVGLIALGIFGSLGTYLTRQARENMEIALASESWQPADGTILESGFTVRGIGRKQAATARVRYEYRFDESTYTGSTLSFAKQDSYSASAAESILEPYPPGAACTVHYDPSNPSKSVLIKGVQSSNTVSYWTGIAFFIFGVVFAIDCGLGAANAYRFPPPKLPLI